MEYMLEMQWIDPVAGRLVEILSVLPPQVVQTASLPRTDHGARSEFALLQVETPSAVDAIAAAMRAAGVRVRLASKAA
jgi:hypothetical protein